MAEVPMVATRDFTYSTRRLKAGDEFPARNSMDARILEKVRRVAQPGKPEEPMARVRQVVAPSLIEDVAETPEAVVEAPKAPRKRRAKAKK